MSGYSLFIELTGNQKEKIDSESIIVACVYVCVSPKRKENMYVHIRTETETDRKEKRGRKREM